MPECMPGFCVEFSFISCYNWEKTSLAFKSYTNIGVKKNANIIYKIPHEVTVPYQYNIVEMKGANYNTIQNSARCGVYNLPCANTNY